MFGIVFARIMNVLLEPITDFNKEKLIEDTKFYCLMIFLIGASCFIAMSISKWCFGTLGENVTLEVRKVLYKSILRKHIGFHDFRENGTSVLTSAMAEDSSIINGVSTESIGPLVDGNCALLIGIAIGFAFCWKEALICLGLAPIMVVGSALAMQLQTGTGTEEDKGAQKEANLLCGDAIVNYKTV